METKPTTTPETINSVPICSTCGSERVARDAWACFNRDSGLWELEQVFDDEHCHQCEGETKLDWVPADALQNKRVRELNDRFRTLGGNGSVVVTSGVKDAGDAFLRAAIEAVQSFTDFSEDNDPWGEHDFGAVSIEGQKVFFKIDYYDPDLKQGSINPANEALTHRVLTIMLASEY
ncbi:DUF3768 domain-containing protein [Litoreibacter halocynthiae]|uniref:DUF3768 domain-containing protein n=1 Tax=Litoreibacter halocynthiae TaxID=1242689 RepID=UPI002490F1FB|nr:DUF3768 domain-containing protein [Litoreibacter halocynthiae]